jgi:glucose/arabinose dehydrogenase
MVTRALSSVLALILGIPVVIGMPPGHSRPAQAAPAPAGFAQQVVLSGLTRPTKLVFSPDGRIFVAQKNGIIKVFDSFSDPTPTVFADLRPQVYDLEDMGLIGLALPPNFPTDPYVYVSYSYDGVINGPPSTYQDACAVIGNCLSSSRVSRLKASGDVMVGAEKVLLHDWCTQIDSHSIGDLGFGPDGALYVTGGDGASATFTDYGQAGNPVNPCGDPPAPAGAALTPPTAEGGGLRAQDIRTPADKTGLSGTLIRINPSNGLALPNNPLAGNADLNNRRIIAYGLRNSFRWSFRPGTNEVWAGDVGWRTWEEINRIVPPTTKTIQNYGWPCYEGNNPQNGYNAANLNLCESLYNAPIGTVTPPYYTYAHSQQVAAGDGCPIGGSAPGGVAFYPATGGSYPATYAGALFFADYARGCIWAMRAGANGLPDPANVVAFSSSAISPVDLEIGPDHDLYYVDLTGGTIRRFHYSSGNQPPVAVVKATPPSGNAPLPVSFDATGTTDPDPGEILSYQWDFNDDGSYDATGSTATHTYAAIGTYTARLRVSDLGGLVDTATIRILVGTSAPVPKIKLGAGAQNWVVGQTITYSGTATDPQDGALPASALSWHLINRHCTTVDNCHTHVVQDRSGVATGSFPGPDHEYPSYLELTLTAVDRGGLTGSTTVRLDPKTVDISLASVPSGLRVNLDGVNHTTPATTQVIVGATISLSAPSPQPTAGATYNFGQWSDGGARTHVVVAPAAATTYTATFTGTTACGDTFGYTCATATGVPFVRAEQTVLPLTGDEAITSVALPFRVPLYGQTYNKVWIDVNGKLSFLDPGRSWGVNTPLPDAAAPNAAVYPFWDDLLARADSSVRTAMLGKAPNRQFVVEWRNIGMYGSTSARITFEVILGERGNIIVNYADLANTAKEMGSTATVGIENAAGTVALPYSVDQAALANGKAITFTPPAVTTVTAPLTTTR